MKVLIVVTHLLGSGHLARALVLARAFNAVGHQTTVISGGMPAAHLSHSDIDFVQLPPLRSDGVDFTRLLDETGTRAPETLMQARCRALKTALVDREPDLLITELFPFGRRILTKEFRALLETADAQNPRPVICASVRDILAPPSKPAKATAAQDLIDQYYQSVLVHSDPGVTPLDASWPVTPGLAAKLRYTGFVAPPPAGPLPHGPGQQTVLVSGGGGAVAKPVYEAAVAAAAQSPDLNWLLLIGGNDAHHRVEALRARAPANATVSLATPDFRHMLFSAAASISLCGYNTALDILQAGTPAVFVPFDDGGEVEQSLRAKALSALDGIAVITSADLTPDHLLRSLRHVMTQPRRTPRTQGLDGAGETVRIAETLVAVQNG